MTPRGLTGPGMASQAEGTVQAKESEVSNQLRRQDMHGGGVQPIHSSMCSCSVEPIFPSVYFAKVHTQCSALGLALGKLWHVRILSSFS